jgi:hypothetical protein
MEKTKIKAGEQDQTRPRPTASTPGQNILCASGEYAPQTSGGKQLLSDEPADTMC